MTSASWIKTSLSFTDFTAALYRIEPGLLSCWAIEAKLILVVELGSPVAVSFDTFFFSSSSIRVVSPVIILSFAAIVSSSFTTLSFSSKSHWSRLLTFERLRLV
ncbi:hypothetical protein BpHYR1_039121 [Brachionus plicatilis]|uniref:Uncharacterized protein n=1 Tax=Brachionus plicatilis TaxID=10195 RepID=A0A3M7Q3X2_BRAPC|nr:hypothetical protein BpHYR1_039121 [Brachionus plicatilis]